MEDNIDLRCEIGIDCPPGEPRPGALFPKVLRGSGLRVSDFEILFKCYGAWLWALKPSAEKQAIFISKRLLFRRRLVDLVQKKVSRGVVLKPEVPKPE